LAGKQDFAVRLPLLGAGQLGWCVQRLLKRIAEPVGSVVGFGLAWFAMPIVQSCRKDTIPRG